MLRYMRKPVFGHRLVRPLFYLVALAITVPLAFKAWERSQPDNGFDLDELAVPADEIVTGGPGRDDIPALIEPEAVPISESDYAADEPVLAITLNGSARAYPVRILRWHEIVNDRLSGEPITVTWCPLCNTGVIYRGRVSGERRVFGVSGLLYRNNLLMYDHETESLWSQLQGEAISGPMRGRKLEALAFRQTHLGDWVSAHPETTVVTPETGYRRDYSSDPYAAYHRSVGGSEKLADRDLVVGVVLAGKAKAYPFSELAARGEQGRIRDSLAGQSFILEYDATTNGFHFEVEDGTQPRTMLSYWFAWKDFHPDTAVFGTK